MGCGRKQATRAVSRDGHAASTLRLDAARPDQTTRHPCARSRLGLRKANCVTARRPIRARRGHPPPGPAEAPWGGAQLLAGRWTLEHLASVGAACHAATAACLHTPPSTLEAPVAPARGQRPSRLLHRVSANTSGTKLLADRPVSWRPPTSTRPQSACLLPLSSTLHVPHVQRPSSALLYVPLTSEDALSPSLTRASCLGPRRWHRNDGQN